MASIPNIYCWNLSLEQLIIRRSRSWTVDLDKQTKTDQDRKIIVQHAIIKNHY